MIVIPEFLPEEGLTFLQGEGFEVYYEPGLWSESDRLKDRVQKAMALVVRNQTSVDRALLSCADCLKVIGRLGVGLDNIDLQAAEEQGIKVIWPRGANATSVAEYVLAAMLLLSRNLFAASLHVQEGGWERSRFGGFEVSGKSLGLVGLGDIGIRVAARAGSLGMKILAVDPARHPYEAVIEEGGIRVVDLGELLDTSHFVSIHVPLTMATRRLFDWETISSMRSGAFLINTARGELLDNEALAEALRSGHLGGAVLDVVEPEPLPARHILREVPNLWITPHMAGLSHEAQERVTYRVTRELVKALRET